MCPGKVGEFVPGNIKIVEPASIEKEKIGENILSGLKHLAFEEFLSLLIFSFLIWHFPAVSQTY